MEESLHRDDPLYYLSFNPLRPGHAKPHEKKGLIRVRHSEISPWRIFKIMSEFVQGFEFLSQYDRTISIFGSARLTLDHPACLESYKLAYDLSKKLNFAIITGGGPGIMEAANKGAKDAGGKSIGLNVKLPFEQRINQYVDEWESFEYFFTRKVMLSFSSEVYVFFPGGIGTMDELFDMIELVQTKKMQAIPIILVGKVFWQPLIDWMESSMYEEYNLISSQDRRIYELVDNAEEAFNLIKRLTSKSRKTASSQKK